MGRDYAFSGKKPEDDGAPCPYTEQEVEKVIENTISIMQSCTLRANIDTVRALTLAASVVSRLSGGARGQVVITANNVLPLVETVLRVLRGVKQSQEQVEVQTQSVV